MRTTLERLTYLVFTMVMLIAGATAVAQQAGPGALDRIGSNWQQANLVATLDPAGSMQVDQGSNIQVRVRSDEDASVLFVLVNPDSKARVLLPRRSATDDRVSRGTEMLFPDPLAGEALYADMPLGKAYLYVLATSEPLLAEPEVGGLSDWIAVDQLYATVAGALKDRAGGIVAVRRIPFQVVSPALQEFVSTEEFVQFYGVGTRSVSNADRGFAIQFAHDSAELTAWGRKQLDAVAQGMTDKRLTEFRFMIEGHTDDQGSDEYNLSLSDRRAKSVWQYLGGHGVDASRLNKKAMGKLQPAMEGTSEKARAENRRVVIRRLDAAR